MTHNENTEGVGNSLLKFAWSHTSNNILRFTEIFRNGTASNEIHSI